MDPNHPKALSDYAILLLDMDDFEDAKGVSNGQIDNLLSLLYK